MWSLFGQCIALNYAIDYPKKVKALVLIAAQYKMPARLLKLQNALFHFMPQSMFQQTGFGKLDFIVCVVPWQNLILAIR